MVVKDKIGRKRYIILYETPNFNSFLRHINVKSNMNVKIVYREDKFLILRINHKLKEKLLNLAKEYNIITIKTTGTIKKAKKLIKNYERIKNKLFL
ncbi:MAG: hypothetical protein ACP5LM_00280 [Thermoplasmata archaeon]